MKPVAYLVKVIYQQGPEELDATMISFNHAQLGPFLSYPAYRQMTQQAKVPEGANVVRILMGDFLYLVDDQSPEFHARLVKHPLAPSYRVRQPQAQPSQPCQHKPLSQQPSHTQQRGIS